MLGSVNSKQVVVFFQFCVAPRIYVVANLLADLSSLVLEVLHYLNVCVNFVYFGDDLVKLLAGFFINSVVDCSLKLLLT